MRTQILIAAALMVPFVVLPSAARAQEAGTLSGERNLGSAGQFRNITATGVTKPPGGGGAASEQRPAEASRRQQTLDRKIETGICIGCN
ncbi:hypothetical protein [Methylobacterium sp. J-068]|uniref:hypothetical protein n=1 Tax=Methylobacterium sp. J-068 TaxID=2836649 RepID=UPI001FB8CB42|nr:hypothetical protein [Methylobacterium sp. J-068]MCJ2034632.1 hypothetical protein [Methylobacterium sp. J-068]